MSQTRLVAVPSLRAARGARGTSREPAWSGLARAGTKRTQRTREHGRTCAARGPDGAASGSWLDRLRLAQEQPDPAVVLLVGRQLRAQLLHLLLDHAELLAQLLALLL